VARFLDPSTIARAFRDPVTWAALIVDFIPIYAVLMLGWGAAPLVFLYWLENLVIGIMTVARMLASGIGKGARGIGAMLFSVPFFIVHYGMFCFGHGMMLMTLQSEEFTGANPAFIAETYPEIVQFAATSGPNMVTFISIIIAFNIFLFAWDYIGKGEYLNASPSSEMFAPYGRIMLLHVALFAGMFALLHFGEPMAGVLALIVLRVIWGLVLSIRRRLRLDLKVDAVS